MPNSFASYAYATEEYAGPPVANSPAVETNQGQFPLRMIEIAPGYGPNDTNPVWVDISADVTDISTRRGRQHTLGRYEAGEMRLTIDNKSGRYSPFNSASAYYNLIRPGMPIRFRALWGAVVYPRFTGVVETWPLTWPGPNDSIVTVTATDSTKFLNLKKATSIVAYSAAVSADAPIAWYRLNDAAGSTTAADSSGNSRTLTKRDYHDVNPALPYTQAYFFQNDGALVADTDASFYAGHYELVLTSMANQYAIAIPGAISIECWVNVSGRQDAIFVAVHNAAGTPAKLILGADTSGNATFYVSGFSNPTVTTTVPVADGNWHHLVGTMTADANEILNLYVDGVLYGTLTATGFSSANAWIYNIIGGHQGVGDVIFSLDGAIDEVAVYNTVLSATQVATHYNAGAKPRQLETTGARVAYLATYTGIPTANQRIDTGQSTVQGATNDWLTKTILQNMQDQATTEDGDLFIDAAGNLTFFDRLHTSLSPYSSVSLILGDRPLGDAALRLPGTAGNYLSTPDSAAVSVGGNLLSANQSQIETDASAWSSNVNAPTLARSTAQFRDGAASLSLTATAAGPASFSAVMASSVPVTAGNVYSASAFFRPGTTTRAVNVDIQWYNGAAFISTTSALSSTEGAGVWTGAYQTSVIAPAGATGAKVEARVAATVAGEVHFVDCIALVPGTGDLSMIWYGSADDWSPAAAKDLISKENPSTQRSYLFDIQPTGVLDLRISPDGSSVAYAAQSIGAAPFADGVFGGVAMAWRATDGRTQFFTTTSSKAAVKAGTATWTQLGTDRTVNAGSIFNSPSLLTVGARGDTGANDPWIGNVQFAEVRNGLATLSGGLLTGGTAVARFDSDAQPVTGTMVPSSFVGGLGETWTVNGAAWSWLTFTPEEPYRLDGLSVPYDDDDVVNEIVVTPAGLAPQITTDATSQTQHGKRTKAISTLSSTVQDAATRAAAELARFKTAIPRIDSVTVNPADDPTMLFGPVLGFDLLTRIQLRRRPMDGSGSLFDQVALIEGIEDRVTKATWQTTWRVSSTDAL